MHFIVGASGELGSRVALRLLDAGEPVRAISRSPYRLQGLVDQGAEAVRGDLREEEWMAPALEGVRSVTLAAHGLVPPSRRNHPGVVDGVGTRRLIDAAQAAGVHHIVYLSAAGVEEQDTLFGKVKLETEAHLRRSGVPWTILRPTVFMENHALLLMGEPLRTSGRVTFFGRGDTPLNWISARDVAGEVVGCLGDPSTRNTVRELGGPQVLTRLQVLRILEEALGREANRRHLPLPMIRFLRFLMGPWHPGMRYLLDLVLTEETLPESMPVARERFTRTGETTLEEVVREWAEAEIPDDPGCEDPGGSGNS